MGAGKFCLQISAKILQEIVESSLQSQDSSACNNSSNLFPEYWNHKEV